MRQNDSETGGSTLSRVWTSLVIISVALLVSGTDACQENYFFAAQVSISPTATVTPTGSVTSTPTATATPTASSSATPTVSATPTATPKTAGLVAGGLLKSLQELGQTPGGSASGAQADSQGNWLGHIYDAQEVPGASADSDGDGYTDELERDAHSDPLDPASTPRRPVTVLAHRLLGVDDDADGLTNADERKIGTDPSNPDTDGDKVNDGAEVLSGSNPRKAGDGLMDSDGDGLSNDYESERGLNWQSRDTDGDGLSDDVELAIGSNPLDNDTDRDGVLDGKEVQLGSDPIVPEPRGAMQRHG